MKKKIHTAVEIANWLLAYNDQPINIVKLQCLLYYSQAYHLALYGTPLFREKILAGVEGPYVQEVYDWFGLREDVGNDKFV